MIETELDPADDNIVLNQVQRYQLNNHLNTSLIELDEDANVISFEEYYPFGSTSFQTSNTSISQKRYRYTGKERDESTGFYYHGARYYAPWLVRWCECDPLESKYAGLSSYNYGFNNPIKWQDSTGTEPDEKKGNNIKVEQGSESTELPSSNSSNVTNTPPPVPIEEDLLTKTRIEFQKEFSKNPDVGDAIKTIIENYGLKEISPISTISGKQSIMNISYSPSLAEQNTFVTTGVEQKGAAQSFQLTQGDYLRALRNGDTSFSQFVLAVAHEVLHGWQKGGLGMKDHAEREFVANQFSVSPNHSIAGREGLLPTGVDFPEPSDFNTVIWASNGLSNYSQISNQDKKSEYRLDAQELLTKFDLAYSKLSEQTKLEKSVTAAYARVKDVRKSL